MARNRITDLFRKMRPESFSETAVADENGEVPAFEDLLPSPEAGPEALFARGVLLDELEYALDELPAEQREVFVALCRILFGGFGWHCSGRSHFHRHMEERWARMTPEERERFRHGLCGRFGLGPSAGGSGEQ